MIHDSRHPMFFQVNLKLLHEYVLWDLGGSAESRGVGVFHTVGLILFVVDATLRVCMRYIY